jgi:hypothetical protein
VALALLAKAWFCLRTVPAMCSSAVRLIELKPPKCWMRWTTAAGEALERRVASAAELRTPLSQGCCSAAPGVWRSSGLLHSRQHCSVAGLPCLVRPHSYSLAHPGTVAMECCTPWHLVSVTPAPPAVLLRN